MEPLVRVIDLTRRFGRQTALAGLDLSLERGEVLGLLGPNGAGKTTCLRILSGNLAPSAGRVEIAGLDMVRDPVGAKRCIGYLPERPPLYNDLRVDEYLRFCARLHRIPRAQVADAVTVARHHCGLNGMERRPIAKLSKGFRQRLGIAQAILHRPRVLILDEPTEGLDPVQVREVHALVRELAQESGIIFSSHRLSEVQAVCDRVAILHQGRQVWGGRWAADADASGWRLRLAPPADGDALGALPCVVAVTALGGDGFRCLLKPAVGPEELVRQVVQAGLGLRALSAERSDLERVFFDLIGAREGT